MMHYRPAAAALTHEEVACGSKTILGDYTDRLAEVDCRHCLAEVSRKATAEVESLTARVAAGKEA